MKIVPYKKVEEPVLLKGLRGDYIIHALIYLIASILVSYGIIMFNISVIIKCTIVVAIAVAFKLKLEKLKQMSKGDPYLNIKKNTRKYLRIIKR